MTTITLRAATVGDLEFIFELHKATLGPYVDQVWGWDDDDQRAYLDRTIDLATTQIIVVDGVDAGRLNLADQDGDVHVGLIEMATDLQRQGIGTHILRGVLDDAFNAGRSVRLSVLKVNTDAYRLYQRLGFVEHPVEGAETDIRAHMRAHPPAQTATPVRGAHPATKPAWQLRAATPRDRGFVVEMARHACVIEDWPLPDPDDDEVREMLPASGAVAIIAEDRQGAPVGAVWVYHSSPPLRIDAAGTPMPELCIAVAPGQRGAGLGAALLDALFAELAQTFATMCTNVHVRNPARRLYERKGFREVGQGHGPLGIAMVKDLRGTGE